MTGEPMKRCRTCHVERPLGEFHRDPHASGGRRSKCRVCTNAYMAAYRSTPEGRARNRAGSARAVADGRAAATMRRARADSPKRYRETARRLRANYASRSPEQIAEARERLRPTGRKQCRRCREWLPVGNFYGCVTRADGLSDQCRACFREADVARRYGVFAPSWDERGLYSCYLCSAPFEHVEHVWPKALGGVDDPENLAPACAACNLSKSDTPLEDFRPDLLALVASWPCEVRLVPAA